MNEPIENDLELNAVAYAFSKIFQPEPTNFNSSFGDRELLSFLRLFLLRGDRGTEKKKTFSAVKDFTSFWWHSGTQQLIGRVKQKKLDQIDEEARLFRGSDVKTKHRRLTNLAFMRLVPGADQAVRHICIRYVKVKIQINFLRG